MQFDKHNSLKYVHKMLLTTPGHKRGKLIYSEHDVPSENKFHIHIVTQPKT